MKRRTFVIAGILALTLAGADAESIKQDARDVADAVVAGAERAGHAIERGARKTGAAVERGTVWAGDQLDSAVDPVTTKLPGEGPAFNVMLDEGRIMHPANVDAGSDLVVRNDENHTERFEIKGQGVDEYAFMRAGESHRFDVNLPRGIYQLSSSDGHESTLHVR